MVYQTTQETVKNMRLNVDIGLLNNQRVNIFPNKMTNASKENRINFKGTCDFCIKSIFKKNSILKQIYVNSVY